MSSIISLGGSAERSVLALPGLFLTVSDMAAVLDPLKDTAVVYGAEPDSSFQNPDSEARSVLAAWRQTHHHAPSLIYGGSFGALTVLHMMAQTESFPDAVFLDGGLFFRLNGLARIPVMKTIMKFIREIRLRPQEEGLDLLMNQSLFQRLFGEMKESQKGLFSAMLSEIRQLDEAAVKAMIESCLSFDFPVLSQEAQERITFFYSKDEPSAHAVEELKKRYPHASIRMTQGYGYAGFMTEKPQEYTELIRTFLKE